MRSSRPFRPSRPSRPIRLGVVAVLVAAAAVVAALAAGPSAAAGGEGARALAERLRAVGAPGVVVLLRDGDEVELAAVGTRRVAAGPAVAATDRFRVGSVTKPFVATVVLQLVGEGRLRLGDTVERWLPGLAPDGRRITVRHLLQHTSGIGDYLNGPTGEQVLAPYFADPGYRWSAKRLALLGLGQPAAFAPGSSWGYSNTNYVLLGMIVQRVTGRPFGAEIRRRVIVPLGLSSTSVPQDGRIAGPHARGYLLPGNPDLETPVPLDVSSLDPSYASSAGALVSTARDLDRFFRALVAGRLLRPAQLAAMQAARAVPGADGFGYGLGLLRLPSPCGVLWGHNGELPGYMANAFVSADGTRSFVTLESTSSLAPARAARREKILETIAADAICR